MRLRLRVKPGACCTKLIRHPDQSFTAFVTKPAEKGQANLAAIKLLAEHSKIAKSKVKIVQGRKSKFKIVEIEL